MFCQDLIKTGLICSSCNPGIVIRKPSLPSLCSELELSAHSVLYISLVLIFCTADLWFDRIVECWESEEIDMDSFLSSSSRLGEASLWWAAGHLASRPHRSLQSDGRDASPFVDFRPPAHDYISLPPHVLYVTTGLLLVLLATYAIVGHLIIDLLHDLADWVFGPKPAAGDAERGCDDEEKIGMEEERAGLLPGFISTAHLQQHYVTSV